MSAIIEAIIYLVCITIVWVILFLIPWYYYCKTARGEDED